jgi:hypothetical protein
MCSEGTLLRMDLYGFFRAWVSFSEPVMASQGGVRACQGLSGHVWACLGLSGPVWACLGLSRPVWSCWGLDVGSGLINFPYCKIYLSQKSVYSENRLKASTPQPYWQINLTISQFTSIVVIRLSLYWYIFEKLKQACKFEQSYINHISPEEGKSFD